MTGADLGRHYIQAQGQWADQNDNAALATATSAATLDPTNDRNFMSQLANARSTVSNMATRKGWSAETTEANLEETSSKLWAARVGAIATIDPTSAFAMLVELH